MMKREIKMPTAGCKSPAVKMAKKRVVVKTPTKTRCKYVAVEAKILNCGKV